MKFSNQFTFYVPSTHSGQTVDLQALQDRTSFVSSIFAKYFGGVTVVSAFGQWVDQTGQIISEPVNLVQSFATDNSHLADLLDLAAELRATYHQECIALQHNNDLYLVE